MRSKGRLKKKKKLRNFCLPEIHHHRLESSKNRLFTCLFFALHKSFDLRINKKVINVKRRGLRKCSYQGSRFWSLRLFEDDFNICKGHPRFLHFSYSLSMSIRWILFNMDPRFLLPCYFFSFSISFSFSFLLISYVSCCIVVVVVVVDGTIGCA